MKIKQFGEHCASTYEGSAKINSPKVSLLDFVRFAKTCETINACDKRASKVKLGEETFNFDELLIPVVLKDMVYPAALTPNGDLDNEADFLTHDFGDIFEFEDEIEIKDNKGVSHKVAVKPFTGYELSRFCRLLYGGWKKTAEVVKVSDIRIAASMTSEVIHMTCMDDKVSATTDRRFPISVIADLISDDTATDSVDNVVKKWIDKVLGDE